MQRTPVRSRALVSVGYDADARELELEFRGGRVYRYAGVPEGVYTFLLRSKEKGAYVSRMIQDRYPYHEVSAEAEEPDLMSALRDSLALSSPGHQSVSARDDDP